VGVAIKFAKVIIFEEMDMGFQNRKVQYKTSII